MRWLTQTSGADTMPIPKLLRKDPAVQIGGSSLSLNRFTGPGGDSVDVSSRADRGVTPMSLLMIEFLTWVSSRPRTYAEAMEAWRSNCPRHTVWEDALADGLIQVDGAGPLQQAEVTLTSRGKAVLEGTP